MDHAIECLRHLAVLVILLVTTFLMSACGELQPETETPETEDNAQTDEEKTEAETEEKPKESEKVEEEK